MTFPKIETVSVIIATWNGAKYIESTLKSVLQQSCPASEIIVVDDGSRDNTVDVVRGYPYVRLIEQTNSGRCLARNMGISQARGDAVVILDQDDLLLPDNIEIGLKMLNENQDAAFSGGCSIVIDDTGRPTGRRHGPLGPCNYRSMLRGSMFLPPSTVMFRTSALREIGGFDAEFHSGGEDSDVYLRMAQKWPIHCHGVDVVAYRRHGENGSNDSLAMLTTSLQFMRKQWSYVEDHPEFKIDWHSGKAHWCALFGRNLVSHGVSLAKSRQFSRAIISFTLALRYHPKSYANFLRFHLEKIRLWGHQR